MRRDAVAHRGALRSDAAVRHLTERVSRELGGVDTLVHAAAVIELGTLETATLAELDLQYETNVRAPYALTKALLPWVRERRGQVVFINSTAGVQAGPGVGQYAATKHALRAIADSLRSEVNADQVRVLTVLLGRTATPMQEAVHKTEGRRYRPEVLIQPEAVAAMVTGALTLPGATEVTEISMRPLVKA